MKKNVIFLKKYYEQCNNRSEDVIICVKRLIEKKFFLKKRYCDNGYYIFRDIGDKEKISNEIKFFLASAIKKGKYVVNIIDKKQYNLSLVEFIIVKKYDVGSGKILLVFGNVSGMYEKVWIHDDEYLKINRVLKEDCYSFNVLTYF